MLDYLVSVNVCFKIQQFFIFRLLLFFYYYYFRHEGRNWYTSHRGRLWIAAAAKQPDPRVVAEMENMYRILRGGAVPELTYVAFHNM